MKGFAIYRNEEVTILEVISNGWLNRIEYLIVHDYQTKWVPEDCLGKVTWIVGA